LIDALYEVSDSGNVLDVLLTTLPSDTAELIDPRLDTLELVSSWLYSIAGAKSVRCSPTFAAARRHAIALGKQGRARPRVGNDVAVQNVRLDP
jgi:hypothetical protein